MRADERTGLRVAAAVTGWALGAVAGILPAAGLLPVAAAPAAGSRAALGVDDIGSRLGPASRPQLPLPDRPVEALAEAVAELSSELGLPRDPAPAIRAAGLSGDVAGRLALVLRGLQACARVTSLHLAALGVERLGDLVAARAQPPHAGFADIRACAGDLWAATRDLEAALRARASPQLAADVDVWPVLRVDEGGADTYANDYLLIVELGGDDTYANNFGSNMVDLNYGPPGSPGLRGTGPARGCQQAIPGLVARDCIPLAAVLVDMDGADTFGVKESPDFDATCTADPVVRRMVVGGVGFLGVGILLDGGLSDDVYTGKTVSLGAGHIFGVGLLVDRGGNDAYSVVRNGEGFALFGGVGVLADEGGNDAYDFYIPGALDPTAPNEAEGAGGVKDDTARCDRIPRFVQGAANLVGGTFGLLVDDGGDDAYHGAFVDTYLSPIPGLSRAAGSLGFGSNLGAGAFVDRGGTDAYVVDGEPAVPGVAPRGNGVVVGPGSASTGTGGGTGAFADG